MKAERKLNGLFAYQAVVYAAGLLLATGLVADWGAWYSTSLPYRAQTEALLHGDLAVSRSVADLRFDHTWSERGVHQVWGLGVPLWRLPFEAAAHLWGFDGFPDRIAFALFALLVSFIVLKGWVGAPHSDSAGSDARSDGWQMIAGFGAGFIILLLFPPFLTLLQVRGAVWEEAVAYEYLFAGLLVTLLVNFVRQPTTGRLLLVCVLAGLGGMIRPTLVFYGFGTVVIATVAWVVSKAGQAFQSLALSAGSSRGDGAQISEVPDAKREGRLSSALSSIANGGEGGRRPGEEVPGSRRPVDGLQACPTLGRVLFPALLGLFLFCLGGGVLWFTNLKRFGDGFEFGHKLNVQYLYGSMHATRFDDPFQDEPLTGAAKELFGALFLANKFNGADWYQENIFPGQSKTVRWREFYFRTYDWSYLPLLLLGWGAAIAAAWKFRTGRHGFGGWDRAARRSEIGPANGAASIGSAMGAPVGAPANCDPPNVDGEPDGCDSSITASFGTNASDGSSFTLSSTVLGWWSLIAVMPLAGFYLYAPVISSRYLMDLAPAFAAAIAGAWLFLAARCERRSSRVLACVLLCAWLGLELFLSRSVYGGPTSITAAELKILREHKSANAGGTNSDAADDYGQTWNGNRSLIPFDRAGWNAETGAVMPLVILIVKNPEFLELDFEAQPHPRIVANPEDIRAKVGLEFLERVKITKTEKGWRVRFRGPQPPRWRAGLQGAFVATVPKRFLAERTTPWVLKSARWRDASAEDASDHR